LPQKPLHQIVFTALRMELSEQYRGCIGLSLIVFSGIYIFIRERKEIKKTN